jgi:tetratricopeptide (TPR) repeat protein
MAWIIPTVLGAVALTAGPDLLAQTTNQDAGKWTIQQTDALAQVESQRVEQSVTSEKVASDSAPAANAQPDVIPIVEAPSSKDPVASITDTDTKIQDETPGGDEETVLQEATNTTVSDSISSDPDEQVGVAADVAVEDQFNPYSSKDGFWRPQTAPVLATEDVQEANRIEKQQRRYNLEQQFTKLQKTLETADGYSLELAEDYFSYGLLLRDDAQYDAAIEAFIDALHIQKVNNGIYSPEQRPALKALFETHYALGNVEEFEDYLERILWVESKNPELEDDFSYKMLVMVGNQYIDQFLRKPIAGQSSVQTLLRAKHHLNAAFKRHRDKPLTVALMPYGELALISFLESQLLDDVDKTASLEDPRLRSSRHIDGSELALASYLANSFPRGSGLLRSYLKKAQTEENLPHVVKALVALGDFNQLFKRHNEAAEYYRLAWTQAQNLPEGHEARALLSAPVSLPAFQYTVDREPVLPTRPTTLIPLRIDIGENGKVDDVRLGNDLEETQKYFSRARRMARRTLFRPVVVDGEPQAIQDPEYQQRVYQRR